MANNNMANGGGKNDKRNGDVKVPARGWILLMAIIAFIPLLYMVRNQAEAKFKTLTYSDFIEKVEKNQIVSGTITYSPQSPLQEIKGKYIDLDSEGKPLLGSVGRPVEHLFQIKTFLTEKRLDQLMATRKFEAAEPNTLLMSVFMTLLPFICLAVLIYF